MVAFPVNAPTLSFGISLNKEFRTLTASFGDGYSIRTGDGLNTQIESWKMTWDIITESEKDILTNFFDARGGFESFDFTAPGDIQKKWIVKNYDETPINATYFKLDAVFERVYDL